MTSSTPALSVALLTPDTFATISRTVGHVVAQDVAREIELLVLAPDVAAIAVPESARARLHSVQVIPVHYGEGSGQARAAAVHAARAPVIAFAEDHCFPEAGWAAALIDSHRGAWAAVGPEVHNANPTNLVSWADLLMGYGPWMAPQGSGERDHLPGHNTSYKRAILLSLREQLPSMMEAETPLQWKLREAGHRMFLDSRARVAHTNFDRMGTWLFVSFHAGRVFAATRALDWPFWRRVAFALASPLVPLVRLRRHLGQARRAEWGLAKVAGLAPTLLLGLIADGAGQAIGSVGGAGHSVATLVAWEFYRNEPRGSRRTPG